MDSNLVFGPGVEAHGPQLGLHELRHRQLDTVVDVIEFEAFAEVVAQRVAS